MVSFDWMGGGHDAEETPPAPAPAPAPEPGMGGQETVPAPETPPAAETAPEPETPTPRKTRVRTRTRSGPTRRDIERILDVSDQLRDEDYAALVDELTGSTDRAGRVEKILEGRWRQPVEDATRIADAGGDMARFKETLRLHDRNPERLKMVVRLLAALSADPDVKWGGNELDVAETVARVIPDVDLSRADGLR